jgi:hypothetical protein
MLNYNVDLLNEYSNVPIRVIPHLKIFLNSDGNLSTISFKKLYQMKFLELLLSEKSSLDTFITRYSESRNDFFWKRN